MRCPICDAETRNSRDEELRQPVETRPTGRIQGRGKETGRKTQLTAREGVQTIYRGWRTILAPVFFYLLVGTGVSFW